MPSRPVSPIERYGYELTIYRRADGNYAAELLSSEGDMWSDLYQARQEGARATCGPTSTRRARRASNSRSR
jgi:hypothetical protein